MDIQKEIESAIPAMMERVKNEQLRNIENAFIRAATTAAEKAGTDWFLTELAPELRAQLDAGKQGLVTIAAGMAETLSQEITASLVASVNKTLKSGHVTQQIAQLIFRGY